MHIFKGLNNEKIQPSTRGNYINNGSCCQCIRLSSCNSW